jgi:hypothetical protein
MMTRRTVILCVIAALALAGVSGAVLGQEKVERSFAYRVGPDGPGGGQIDFHFDGPGGPMAFMMADGKQVKGAPYSAQAVNESIQTLADGNRLVRRSTSQLFRDSEGRTRREESGPAKMSGDQSQTIFINDPVAGFNYVLNTRDKSAHKMPSTSFNVTWTSDDGKNVEKVITVEGKAEARIKRRSEDHEVMVKGPAAGGVFVHSGSPEPYASAKGQKESLGKQLFDGVEAEGTRVTLTIPAGEIGNEQPIYIITERWYSPELQITVMTRHNDPRFGETTYRLTNISRTEPARALFEPPSDYTISTDGPMIRKMRKPQEQ